MQHAIPSSFQVGLVNPYKFNGIERIEDHSLGWDLTLHRAYDPIIGRFTGVDPLAEVAQDWTPYRFGFNSPINFSDPLGLYESKLAKAFNPSKYFEEAVGIEMGGFGNSGYKPTNSESSDDAKEDEDDESSENDNIASEFDYAKQILIDIKRLFEWLTGLAPEHEEFGDGDYITEIMKGSPGVHQAISEFKRTGSDVTGFPFQFSPDISSIQGLRNTVQNSFFYHIDALINPVRGFFGGYSVDVLGTDTPNQVMIHIRNSTTINSFALHQVGEAANKVRIPFPIPQPMSTTHQVVSFPYNLDE